MRGDDAICGSLFSYIDLEKRVRADHPLRVIRQIANAALKSLSGEFAKVYSAIGRESIPPERLMPPCCCRRSIRSARSGNWSSGSTTICCFAGLSGSASEDAVWDATSFTKNRDRLLDVAVAGKFLAAVLSQDKVKRLLSSEHFSVDGTLLEAWASTKIFRPKDGSGEPPGRAGLPRRAPPERHALVDHRPRLFRNGPGKEARLCFMGNPRWRTATA
jgi:transposase